MGVVDLFNMRRLASHLELCQGFTIYWEDTTFL